LIDRAERVGAVTAVGVDETTFARANPIRSTVFATGIVDLHRGKLIGIIPGRSRKVLADWLIDQPAEWTAGIEVAALDPFRGYGAALSAGLPHAVRVLDAFHVVRLGFAAVDDVRRRVQQHTYGHRGRRRARSGRPRLGRRQELRAIYHCRDRDQAAARLYDWTVMCIDSQVPELGRLARTLTTWRDEFLAYFNTGRISNGPTEAVNLLIKKILRVGHGFRNFGNYRLRLLLHCGITWQHHTPTPLRGRLPRLPA
jgi:transposase